MSQPVIPKQFYYEKKMLVIEIMKAEYLSCQLIKIASQTHLTTAINAEKII